MDPLLRLTIMLSRLSRRRWTRLQVAIAMGALVLALAVGLIEWAGYWPESWQVNRGRGLPRVQPL